MASNRSNVELHFAPQRGAAMIQRRALVPSFFLVAAFLLVPWSGWLVISLPCRYLSHHWGIAWAGFDGGLALALALTGLALVRRASWLDRAAVAAGTLLAADAWFDVVTSRAVAAVVVATVEALAVELPVALLCIWVVHAFATPRSHQQQSTAAINPREAPR
jgi:hypothetical protein